MKQFLSLLLCSMGLLTHTTTHGQPQTGNCDTPEGTARSFIDKAELYSKQKWSAIALICAQKALESANKTNEEHVHALVLVAKTTRTILPWTLSENSAQKEALIKLENMQKNLLILFRAITELQKKEGQQWLNVTKVIKQRAKKLLTSYAGRFTLLHVQVHKPHMGITLIYNKSEINPISRIALYSAKALLQKTEKRSITLILPVKKGSKYIAHLTGHTQNKQVSTPQPFTSNIIELQAGPFSYPMPPPPKTPNKTPWGAIIGTGVGALVIGGLVMWFAQPEAVLDTPQPRNNRSVH